MRYDEDEPRDQALAEMDREAGEREEDRMAAEREDEKRQRQLWFCSECHEPNVEPRVSCATCREPRCTCATAGPDMDGQFDQIEKESCPRHG